MILKISAGSIDFLINEAKTIRNLYWEKYDRVSYNTTQKSMKCG